LGECLRGSWDDERDPLAALRGGDRGPFEQFVRSEAATLLRFFQRHGASLGEAEDLAQEVFLKLYRSAPTYRAQSRFSSYVLRVARNAWIDRRRRRAVRPEGPSLDEASGGNEASDGNASLLELLPGSDPEVSRRAERREERERVQAALAHLPESHSIVIELALVQQRPYAEISELLGIPIGTVKSRVFHALRKLREILGEEQLP